jgi:hypothetical protein
VTQQETLSGNQCIKPRLYAILSRYEIQRTSFYKKIVMQFQKIVRFIREQDCRGNAATPYNRTVDHTRLQHL